MSDTREVHSELVHELFLRVLQSTHLFDTHSVMSINLANTSRCFRKNNGKRWSKTTTLLSLRHTCAHYRKQVSLHRGGIRNPSLTGPNGPCRDRTKYFNGHQVAIGLRHIRTIRQDDYIFRKSLPFWNNKLHAMKTSTVSDLGQFWTKYFNGCQIWARLVHLCCWTGWGSDGFKQLTQLYSIFQHQPLNMVCFWFRKLLWKGTYKLPMTATDSNNSPPLWAPWT